MIAKQTSRLLVVSCAVICGPLFVLSVRAAQTAGPHNSLTVDASGAANFKTVQQAVDALPASGGIIRIRPGTYREQIHIDKPNVQLLGVGKDPSQVVLTFNLSHHDVGTTSGSASTTVTGDDFLAENLTFQNTFSDEHPDVTVDAQAVALRVTGDRDVFRHVRILARQDTLYAESAKCRPQTGPGTNPVSSGGPGATPPHGADRPAPTVPCSASRQLYADSYIAGTIDFIFRDAKAVFENCEIRSRPHQEGTLTAQSRFYAGEDSGYLFDNCTLTADPGVKDVYLGRPWRLYSTVVFLHTEMGAQIAPAGWLEWIRNNTAGLATSFYAEYRSTVPGAPQPAQGTPANPGPNGTQRLPQGKILTAAQAKQYDPRAFLRGSDHWTPNL